MFFFSIRCLFSIQSHAKQLSANSIYRFFFLSYSCIRRERKTENRVWRAHTHMNPYGFSVFNANNLFYYYFENCVVNKLWLCVFGIWAIKFNRRLFNVSCSMFRILSWGFMQIACMWFLRFIPLTFFCLFFSFSINW